MSALGQKQTYAAQNVMSALPPKADMCGAAMGQQRTHVAKVTEPQQGGSLGFQGLEVPSRRQFLEHSPFGLNREQQSDEPADQCDCCERSEDILDTEVANDPADQ